MNIRLVTFGRSIVASSIIELICDDLKYQDKQNDPQFLMLNNKLREDKRINKIKKHMEKEEKKNQKHPKEKSKRTSKFSNKYSERIASIREADEMIKLKEEKMKKKTKTKNKTPQKIRDEMLKTLKDSKLK